MYSLHESVTTTAASLVFLELHIFQLAEWREDGLEVAFVDVEVNVAYIKSMERDAT